MMIKSVIKIIEWPDLIKTPVSNKLEIYLNYVKDVNERKLEIIRKRKMEKF